jgi:spoIIIJ-associated protein
VEWVETTGRSIDEAKEAALDRLGVDEPDAEFEIVEEAKAGLFGRVRREARVRARIKPTRPRAKQDRRDRRRRGRRDGADGERSKGGSSKQNGSRSRGSGNRTAKPDAGAAAPASTDDDTSAGANGDERAQAGAGSGSGQGNRRRRRGGRGRGGGGNAGRTSTRSTTAGAGTPRDHDHDGEPNRGEQAMSEVSLEEQGEIVQDFLDGLVDAFDLDGELRTEEIDEEMLEVQIVGDDLGLLIGPKGQTLAAVQELARTVVQRRAEGNPRGRFRVDVGGYRQRRREALERFTQSVADEVKSSGVQKALEPMNAADRKVVHDTINDIDGVETTSEGEEPRRRVVILPAS